MNSIDTLAQQRNVIYPVVLAEFNRWLDSKRQEHTPSTMEGAIVMWQQELGIAALTRAANGGFK